MSTTASFKLTAMGRRGQLTPEQVQEIRLATPPLKGLAAKFGVTLSVIDSVRQGRSYAYLPMPRREVFSEWVNPWETLTIGRLRPTLGMGTLDRQEALDAAWEDRNGRLPHEESYGVSR